MISRLAKGDRSGAGISGSPHPKELSRGFSYTIPGETHMDRAAGWTGLTLHCYDLVPLSQNTCWSLSMILQALCNPSLHLQMSIYSLLPSSPQNDAYAQALTFFSSLKFPPLSSYQSTSGPLTTSSTEQRYIFSMQHLTSLFIPFFLFGLLHVGRKHFH